MKDNRRWRLDDDHQISLNDAAKYIRGDCLNKTVTTAYMWQNI